MTGPLTRHLIVATARSMVEAESVGALSLRGVARSLGVTAPALYDHVDSKPDLLRAVADSGYADLAMSFESSSGLDPLDAMVENARQYVAFAMAHRGLFSLMFRYRPAAIVLSVDNELAGATHAFEASLAHVVAALEAGLLAPGDPLELGLVMWSAVHGVATVCLLAPELNAEGRLLDQVLHTVLRGMGALARPVGGSW